MDDNPLSPYSTGAGGSAGGPTEFSPRGWDVGEILAEAWEVVKAQWLALLIGLGVFLMVTMTVNLVVNFAPSILQVGLEGAQRDGGGSEVLMVGVALASCCGAFVNTAVQTFMTVGLVRYLLAVVRGEEASAGLLFSGGDRVVSLFVVQLIVGFATLFGFILLIIPGMILALGLSQAQYLVADSSLGAVDCVRASWQLTDGHKLNLFLLGLALAGLAIVGLIPCGLGLIVVMPLGAVAFPLVYIRLTGRTSSAMGDPVVV